MRIPGTEMHPVTGLLVLLELILLGAQLISWLYFPKERRGLLYTWLLVLMILYNVFGGFFPDPGIHWLNLKLQMILAYGSGFAVAAYIPYYFYKGFGLERLRFFAYTGMVLFLALPYVAFFVVAYEVQGDISFAIRWGLIAPACYGVAFLAWAYKAIGEKYRANLAAQRLEMYLTYAAVLPWICMVPFAYLGVGQLPEVLTTNTGFLVITAILIARSVRERRLEQADFLRLKNRNERIPSEAAFEQHLLLYGFSSREVEVIRLLRQGYTKQEIGDKLFIATTTVSRHTQNIYYKADVNNRLELMRKLEMED